MPQNPTKRVLITMDANLIDWLDEEANRLDRSRAWLMNRYCTQAMNRKEYQRGGKKRGTRRKSRKT